MVLWLRFLTEINSNTKDIPADLLNDPETVSYTHLIRTEVGVQIMHTVLRKDSDFVKRFSHKIQEGIAHLFHS